MGHTPGEWTTDACAIQAKREDGTTFDLARVYWPEPGRDEEFTANSNLIAAAPDLLESCKELVGIRDGTTLLGAIDSIFTKARAAILKAEGKS